MRFPAPRPVHGRPRPSADRVQIRFTVQAPDPGHVPFVVTQAPAPFVVLSPSGLDAMAHGLQHVRLGRGATRAPSRFFPGRRPRTRRLVVATRQRLRPLAVFDQKFVQAVVRIRLVHRASITATAVARVYGRGSRNRFCQFIIIIIIWLIMKFYWNLYEQILLVNFEKKISFCTFQKEKRVFFVFRAYTPRVLSNRIINI